MTDNPASFDSWSVSLLQRVNEACDRFRTAWKAGQRPRIEDFLAGTAEQERSAYLRELLALELELRSKGGETATQRNTTAGSPVTAS